ncbi:hypothetical protein B0H17DRAFT_1140473 [Mycena rosella]|uniref:Uncharacterized protein n=1 Tax=Mycena rosella TaxID=1033263 RepID=A0AAD7D237_MYCRO|nr:hypothetical protein B0H17DRAFT_1140473 [Mycena rosella]
MPKLAPSLLPREIVPKSAAHTTFRLKQLLPATSKDAVEIGTWICFRELRKSKPVLAFTVGNNQVLLKHEMEVMTAARFISPAFALQSGNHAIMLPPTGTLAGADIWITQIQDFVHEGSNRYTLLRGALIEGKDVVRLAHLSPHYRNDALTKGGISGSVSAVLCLGPYRERQMGNDACTPKRVSNARKSSDFTGTIIRVGYCLVKIK